MFSTAFPLLVVLLFAGVFAQSLESICSSDRTCFSEPENCQVKQCGTILSFGDNVTQIYVNDIDYTHNFIIYIHKDGVLQEDVVACFGGLTRCFLGNEKPGEQYTVQKKQQVELSIISDDYGQFIYTFPRVLMDSGNNIKYSTRRGRPEDILPKGQMKFLFHRKSSKAVEAHKVNNNGSDVKTLSVMYEGLDENKRDPQARFRKSPPIKMTSLQEIYDSRMIFSQRRR